MDGEQLARDSGIFRQYQVGRRQRRQRPQGDVAGVADRGGQDVQTRREFPLPKRFTLACGTLMVGV